MGNDTETTPKPIEGIPLEESIRRLVDFVDGLPDQYKDRVFDKLLDHTISESLNGNGRQPQMTENRGNSQYILPIPVRAFLNQFEIPEKIIHQHFIIDGPEQITPTYRLKSKALAQAQIQTSLLLALENALADGKFEFALEDLRARCKENRSYEPNFFTNIKARTKFYMSLSDREHIRLSSLGKEHLADLLDELSNKA